MDLKLPQVIGHRGAALAAPENTLESFREAASQGANQTDFLIGCTRIGIGDVPNTVDVPLTLFSSNVSVPASSKCSTLSAKCSGTICF